jgi:hypothetical protein
VLMTFGWSDAQNSPIPPSFFAPAIQVLGLDDPAPSRYRANCDDLQEDVGRNGAPWSLVSPVHTTSSDTTRAGFTPVSL